LEYHKKVDRLLIRIDPQKPPVLSLRGAFFATKQSPVFMKGLLPQKTPHNDKF